MRDYLSPAKKRFNGVVVRVAALKSLATKRNIMITTGLVATVAIASAATVFNRANGNTSNYEAVSSQTQPVDNNAVSSTSSEAQTLTSEPKGDNSTKLNSNNSSTSSTSITVNDQNIPVPENGTIHKTVQSGNGTSTTVDVSHSSTSDQNTTTNKSVNLSVNTHTSNVSHTSRTNTSSD